MFTGSFHMISLMSSDYLQHSVELILLDDFINRIMQSVPSELNTSGLYQKDGLGNNISSITVRQYVVLYVVVFKLTRIILLKYISQISAKNYQIKLVEHRYA